jgi:hypothetical protein
MSRKALERELLSVYTDSMRGTWREGSHTEDSVRHVSEGSENRAFLLTGAPREEPEVI